MDAYSVDLRRRVFADSDAGLGTREVALKYRVSESWVRRLKQRRRETGETLPRRSGWRRPTKWEAERERLAQFVKERPDITLRELGDKFGGALSVQTLSRALRAMKLTFKKSNPRRRTRSRRCTNAARRLARGDARLRVASLGFY